MENKNMSNNEEPVSGQKKSHSFIKNNQYFTICIYAAVMVLISAVIFKCIIDIDQTKAMISYFFTMLSPFIFGALLAYILNPMVHMFYVQIGKLQKNLPVLYEKNLLPKLQTRFPELKPFTIHLSHTVHVILSIMITYIIVLGFVILTIVYIVPEITKSIVDFVNYIPTGYNVVLNYIARLQVRFPSLNLEQITQPLTDALPNIIKSLQEFASSLLPTVYSLSVYIASWFINVLITIIVSIYMLYDKRRLMRGSWKLVYAFLPQKHLAACHEILTECNRLFSSFVVGKFIDSLIIGCICFVLMTIFRFPYTLLISMIVGITNMIPYFGPFIGAVPGVLIMLFINPLQALGFAVMILVLQQFDGLILGPRILGNSTGMKPLWIIVAITIGGKLAGVIGMFLGVPVAAILGYLAKMFLDYRLAKRNITPDMIDAAIKDTRFED